MRQERQKTFEEKLREILGEEASERTIKRIKKLVSRLNQIDKATLEKFTLTVARIAAGVAKKK